VAESPRTRPGAARVLAGLAAVGIVVGATAAATPAAPAHAKPSWQSPPLDGVVQARPLVVGDVVVVATENNSLYGLALSDGHRVWGPRHVGTPVPLSAVAAANHAAAGCGDIDPLGITGSPVVDLAARPPRVYAVAEVLGPDGRSPVHELVGVEPTSGRVVVVPTPIDPPAMTHPELEQQRAALAFANGMVYVGFGGLYGDCGVYHGFVVAVHADGSGLGGVFEAASESGNAGAAVWAPTGVTFDAAGRLYAATGNSLHPPPGTAIDNSDSVVRIDPVTGSVLDVFQPSSWRDDNARDLDLGSTAPVLLADGHLFEAGKQNRAYLLDPTTLGGVDHHTPLASLGLCSAFGGNAALGTSVFVACTGGVQQVLVDTNPPRLRHGWTTSTGADGPVTVGAGLVWSVDRSAGMLDGLDPATGHVVAAHPVALDSSQHFPIVAIAAGHAVVEAGRRVVAFTVARRSTTTSS
jgi:putative pyrroloquinoline-quinone binding quinoprotein